MKRSSMAFGSTIGCGLAVLLWAILASPRSQAQTPVQVNLSTTVSPSAGTPGVTTVTLTGIGFPPGTIAPEALTVTLTPANTGSGLPTGTARASAIVALPGTARRISFLIPASLAGLTAATTYQVGIGGSTAGGTVFASANTVSLTLNPSAAIGAVSPAAGAAGQTLAVLLTGKGTNFLQGATQASFGNGITVGAGQPGDFGSVYVVSRTSAIAIVRIADGAGVGLRNISVKTGTEVISGASAFAIGTDQTPSTAFTLASLTNPSTALPGITTVTASGSSFPSGVITSDQATVLLEPAAPGAGPTVTAPVTSISDDPSGAKLISFIVPNSISSPSPVAYLVSVYGSTSGYGALSSGFTFASSNQASLTVGQAASLVSLSPFFGTQGTSLTVTMTAQGSHFVQGITEANFGAGIAVGDQTAGGFGSVTVTSPTTATAQVNIAALAATGLRTVQVATSTEVLSLPNGFNVLAAGVQTPTITSVVPGTGQQAQTVSLKISSANTNFVQGQTVADFGAGITAGSVQVTSATSASVSVSIASNAPVGSRTVTLTTGTETAQLANGFTVQPAAPQPTITSIQPSSGKQGTSLTVTIAGQNTSFTQGSTTVSFGAGILVSNVTVQSATSLTAAVQILANANSGTRSVAVTTGAQTATAVNGFTVEPAVTEPVITAVSPSFGQQGQKISVVIAGQNTSFSSSSQIEAGSGITIDSVAAPNATTLIANFNVAPNAVVGARTVKVTTGSQALTLANGFFIQQNTPATLTAATPSIAGQGSTTNVAITGQNTSFVQGTSQVNLGAGVSVNSVNVGSPTSLTAQISVDPSAAPGNRDVIVTTNGEVAALSGGFRVSGPAPAVTILSPAPRTLLSKGTVTVTGTVSDASAVVAVNGQPATLSGGTFTASDVLLKEGASVLTATATNRDGLVGSASVSLVVDTTAPRVRIDTPNNGAILTATTATVSGMVNDIVSGTVNPEQVSVSVNGISATVSNRSFEIPDFLLVRGKNVLTAVATDKAGNSSSSSITLNVQDTAAQQKIVILSGNNQAGEIGSVLKAPLVVQLLDANGNAMAGRNVTFTVRRSDGVLTASPQQGQEISTITDAKGFAQATFQLGTRVGVGMNQVAVTSAGFSGETIFCASATVSAPTTMRDAGVMATVQVGIAGQPLPMPFEVIVFDKGGNPVANIPVKFSVEQGGGKVGGQPSVTNKTDSDGKTSVLLTLGQQEGISNNIVSAQFEESTEQPLIFQASGVLPSSAKTTVSGVVLDNTNTPIPSATAKIVGTSLSAQTDDQGKFIIAGVSSGTATLIVDGSTSSRSEKFPFLAFQMQVFSGIDNTLGMPIFLPILDAGNSKIVGGNEEVVLTMTGVPGVAFTVAPNSVTFPDGSHVGPLSLSQVHADKVPMPPPYGTAPKVVWTLQPAGTKFDPPIRVQLPNADNLIAGQVVEIFQFDHDLEQFVSVGTARVSPDASVLTTDAGFGITKAGWGTPAPPPPPKECVDGCKGDACNSAACVNGACVTSPSNEGGQCGDEKNQCGVGVCRRGACVIDSKATDGSACTPDDTCLQNPKCQDGQCVGDQPKFKTQIGTGLEGELEIPETFKEKIKFLFAKLGAGDVEVSEVKVGIEGSAKDCCSKESGFVALGEQEAKANVGLDVTLADVPLEGFTLDVQVDIYVATATLKVKVGLFFTQNVSIKGEVGKKNDQCENKGCTFGEVSLSAKGEFLKATLAVEACISTLVTAKECEGEAITPAALSSTISVGLGYNKDRECKAGLKGFVSFGKLIASGEISIKYGGITRKVGYEWELLPGYTFFFP